MKSVKNRLNAKTVRFAGLLLVPLISAGIWQLNTTFQLPARADIAQEGLPPIAPNLAPGILAEETLNNRFSYDNSLQRIEQIRGALSSFVELTQRSEPILGNDVMEEFDYTGWDAQNLGFPNWTGAVEGTLRKQEYQIRELEFELAKEQYEDGEISREILEEKEAAYERAEEEFEQFWNSFQIVD